MQTMSDINQPTLRQLRVAKGMTQAELAALVGFTAQAWSRVERGESSLRPKHVPKVAKALGVDPLLVARLVEASRSQ